MSGEDEKEDAVPEGVCTAQKCKCAKFVPNYAANAPMYCARKNCGHSVEWHHLNSREIDA